MSSASFVILVVQCAVLVNGNTVSTSQGNIVGSTVIVNRDNQQYTVQTYLGIPFAKPPVGSRRFQMPEPLDTKYVDFQATKLSPMCPQVGNQSMFQINPPQDEDCLYLNIYVPDQAPDLTSGHAVMFWIHGGGFTLGAGVEYDGAFLASAGNVIVVTINYRLGAFGFLSLDEHIPANLGLWDQRLALQWVNDHIEAFKGDRSRITIFGESAGGMSCSIHSLYPANHGLFQRAIFESGTANIWVFDFTTDVKPTLEAIASSLGCKTDDSGTMVACLKTKSWHDIYSKINEMSIDPKFAQLMEFSPVVDGEIIKYDPKELTAMTETKTPDEVVFFQSLDIINGYNSHEGGILLAIVENPEDFQPTQELMLNQAIPGWIYYILGRTYPEPVNKLILAEYTNWTDPENYESIRLQYVKLHSDTMMTAGVMAMTHVHARDNNQGQIYMYYFSAKPSNPLYPVPSWVPGANHAEEIPYVFGNISRFQPWEETLSMTMITYWSNFAKTGDPNSGALVQPAWPVWTTETQHVITLDENMNDNSVKQYIGARENNFWSHVFPSITSALDGSTSAPCGISLASSVYASVALIVLVILFTVL